MSDLFYFSPLCLRVFTRLYTFQALDAFVKRSPDFCSLIFGPGSGNLVQSRCFYFSRVLKSGADMIRSSRVIPLRSAQKPARIMHTLFSTSVLTFLAGHAGGHPSGCPHRAGLILKKKKTCFNFSCNLKFSGFSEGACVENLRKKVFFAWRRYSLLL